jgi:hypothetical protein
MCTVVHVYYSTIQQAFRCLLKNCRDSQIYIYIHIWYKIYIYIYVYMIFSHGIPIQRVETGVTLSHSLLGPGVQQKSRAPPHLRTGRSRLGNQSKKWVQRSDFSHFVYVIYIYIHIYIFYVLYDIYYINIIYTYIYAMTSKILLRFGLWFLQEGIDDRPSIFLTQFRGGCFWAAKRSHGRMPWCKRTSRWALWLCYIYIYGPITITISPSYSIDI